MIPTRQKLGRGRTWLGVGVRAFAAAGVAMALVGGAGCQSTDGPPAGPPPVITSVNRGEQLVITATRTDAGAPVGCCKFGVSIQFNLEDNDFIRYATIEWDDDRLSKTRFQYNPDPQGSYSGDGSGTGRQVSFEGALPGVMVDGSKDVTRSFVARLHAAGGGVSAPAQGSFLVR